MNNLKIMNYEDKPFDTGIHLEDVEYVYVTVISGDELLEIHINDRNIIHIDSADIAGNHRIINFYDGSYIVNASHLEEWNSRTSTYQYYENMFDNALDNVID